MSAAKAICDHMRDIWTGTPEVDPFIVFIYFFLDCVSLSLSLYVCVYVCMSLSTYIYSLKSSDVFYALKCRYYWNNMNIIWWTFFF